MLKSFSWCRGSMGRYHHRQARWLCHRWRVGLMWPIISQTGLTISLIIFYSQPRRIVGDHICGRPESSSQYLHHPQHFFNPWSGGNPSLNGHSGRFQSESLLDFHRKLCRRCRYSPEDATRDRQYERLQFFATLELTAIVMLALCAAMICWFPGMVHSSLIGKMGLLARICGW